MQNLNEILVKIDDLSASLKEELCTVKSGTRNKAAARRARKLTLELSQVFKDFRKISVKEV